MRAVIAVLALGLLCESFACFVASCRYQVRDCVAFTSLAIAAVLLASW
jgi:hypothetical protein